MTNEADFKDIACALEGTISAPHFNRTAFKVNRTYATLAAGGLSANLKFTPDEQELKCMVHPEAFTPVDNKWGQQGWTVCTLAAVTEGELSAALVMAWRHAVPKKVQR